MQIPYTYINHWCTDKFPSSLVPDFSSPLCIMQQTTGRVKDQTAGKAFSRSVCIFCIKMSIFLSSLLSPLRSRFPSRPIIITCQHTGLRPPVKALYTWPDIRHCLPNKRSHTISSEKALWNRVISRTWILLRKKDCSERVVSFHFFLSPLTSRRVRDGERRGALVCEEMISTLGLQHFLEKGVATR